MGASGLVLWVNCYILTSRYSRCMPIGMFFICLCFGPGDIWIQTLKFIYDDRRLLPFKSLRLPVVVNSGELSWPVQHGTVGLLSSPSSTVSSLRDINSPNRVWLQGHWMSIVNQWQNISLGILILLTLLSRAKLCFCIFSICLSFGL